MSYMAARVRVTLNTLTLYLAGKPRLRPAAGALNTLWYLFAAQSFEQLWDKLNKGHHHQDKAGIKLAGGIIATVFLGLIKQQIFKAYAFNGQLVVD